MRERLQKTLARCGVGSRRKCEELIAASRIKVNGKVVSTPGSLVDPGNDTILVDDVEVSAETGQYYLLHKPRGYICTSRPRRGESVAVNLVATPKGERIYTVGRLDADSCGALILTNDGAFCNLVTHPKFGIAKTYRVVVRGKAEGQLLEKIRKGIYLAEGKTTPAKIHVVKRSRNLSILKVTLREGKNRHLRRVFAQVGLPVAEILRTKIGPISLGRMKAGEYRLLSPQEVDILREEALRGKKTEKKAAAPRKTASGS